MSSQKKLPGIFLAGLPVLFQTMDFRLAALSGILATLAFWVTAFFFSATRTIFPKRVMMTMLMTGMAVFALCGYYLFELQPYWILSTLLLLPYSFEHPGRRHFPKEPFPVVMRRGLLFLGFIFYLTVFHEWLGRRMGILIFKEPAGSWLLTGVALVLCPGLAESSLAESVAGKRRLA